jgi:hypothetical protein
MHQSPSQGRLLLNSGAFTGVKVFAASMMAERALLGDKVTAWLETHPEHQVTEIVVTQSSDSSYHCLAFSIFYRARSGAATRAA